jgi:hypothetical protein
MRKYGTLKETGIEEMGNIPVYSNDPQEPVVVNYGTLVKLVNSLSVETQETIIANLIMQLRQVKNDPNCEYKLDAAMLKCQEWQDFHTTIWNIQEEMETRENWNGTDEMGYDQGRIHLSTDTTFSDDTDEEA